MKIEKKVFNNRLKGLQLDCYGAKMIVDVNTFLNLVTPGITLAIQGSFILLKAFFTTPNSGPFSLLKNFFG